LLSVNNINTADISNDELNKILVAGVTVLVVKQKALLNYHRIRQHWDYSHPCTYCGYVYLEADKVRSQCCMDGKALDAHFFHNWI
jgi:hypothetical protein